MHTLILAGGNGTRLFPLSRKLYPKQFIPLVDHESLFQKTVQRALQFSKPDDVLVVTNKDHKFLALDQLNELGADCRILLEPEGKNTLPAIAFGISSIEENSSSSKVAILPSDHLIRADESYNTQMKNAVKIADHHLVTFGIQPSCPHTGYGYIKCGECLDEGYLVDQFVEKPDVETAQRYLDEGYLWNSGMFMFDTSLFWDECTQHAPDVAECFRLPIEEAFARTPALSIDYGIMEKTDRAAVVPLPPIWNDLGSFDALYEVSPKNEEGNVIEGEHIGIDSHGNLIHSDRLVATIGINDMCVVDTRDVLLLCPKNTSQNVNVIVKRLNERHDERTDIHMTVHRPWGSYTVLEDWPTFKIKRITVLPKRRISAQLHHHRSEHWITVKGTACVHIGEKSFFLRPGESTFVPAGNVHRLENPGLIPLEMIEVQNGEYLGEDDIIRYEDDYER